MAYPTSKSLFSFLFLQARTNTEMVVGGVLLLAVIVFGGLLAIWCIRRWRRRAFMVWEEVAQRHEGLTFVEEPGADDGEGRLVGVIEGVFVEAYRIVVGTRESAHTYTIVSAKAHCRLPGGLELARQRLPAIIRKVLRLEDIQVGDSDFDSKVVVKGAASEEIRMFLSDSNLRKAIVEAFKVAPTLKVKEGKVTISVSGLVRRAEKLENLLYTATSLSRAFENAADKIAEGSGERTCPPFRNIWRLDSADSGGLFMVVMMIPLFLILYIMILGFPSMVGWDCPIWARFLLLGGVTAGLVTFAVKKFPGKMQVEITSDKMIFQDNKKRQKIFSLPHSSWAMGLWGVKMPVGYSGGSGADGGVVPRSGKPGYQHVGVILYVRQGDNQISIGGQFVNPGLGVEVSESIPLGETCDVSMRKDMFLNFIDCFKRAYAGSRSAVNNK